MLSDLGYDVHAVENGVEAIKSFFRGEYDIVLLDMDMPSMGGAEVIEKIRERGVRVPIVVLSEFDQYELSVLGKDGGADDFVSKNWPPQSLLIRLDKRLRDTLKRVEEGERVVFRLSADTTFDKDKRVLIVKGQKQHLKPMLAKVMWMLCTRKNEDITIKELCMWFWGVENEVKASELSSYISDLRKKLKPDESIELLRGFGGTYKLITMEL